MTDGATEMDVPESVYRAQGYQSDFDKLPWKNKYDAKKSSEREGVRPKPKARSARRAGLPGVMPEHVLQILRLAWMGRFIGAPTSSPRMS